MGCSTISRLGTPFLADRDTFTGAGGRAAGEVGSVDCTRVVRRLRGADARTADFGPHGPQHASEEEIEECKERVVEDAELRFAHEASKRMCVLPTLMMSPSSSGLLALDAQPVHLRAVGAAEVGHHVALAGRADLAVTTRDVGVGERDGAVGQAADGGGLCAQADALAAGQHQRTDAATTAGFLHVALDREAAGLHLVVDHHFDGDIAHEVIPLRAGVLAGGLTELGVERVVDLGEAGVIARAERNGEQVRHDAPTLHVDAAMIVDLAEETTPQFDRTDGGLGAAGKHALDHTLQTVLE